MHEWFRTLCADLYDPTAVIKVFGGNRIGSGMLEVLTDASNELFAAGIIAAHLRRFGAAHHPQVANGHFWVRSEWAKFDMCYGIATARFRDWNLAWDNGVTGDCGIIELKVIYSHYDDSKKAEKMDELSRQLKARQEAVRKASNGFPNGDVNNLAFHGIVLYVDSTESPVCRPLSLKAEGLQQVSDWELSGMLQAEELLGIWPIEGMHRRELRMALFESERAATS